MGLLGVRHDWVTSLSLFTFMHWRRKWQLTPVFLHGESQGRGILGGLPSVGSHRVRHDWSDLAAAAEEEKAKDFSHLLLIYRYWLSPSSFSFLNLLEHIIIEIQRWRSWSWFYEDLQDLLKLTPKKDVLFIIGDWNAKVGSQETPGVTGKFGLEVQKQGKG